MNLALCIPGSTFSGNFLDCFMKFVTTCMGNKINVMVSRTEAPNVFSVRNACLGGSFLLGPKQVPFGGDVRVGTQEGFKYDYMLWVDSDMIWSFEDFQKLLSRDKDFISGIARIRGTGTYNAGMWDLPYLINNGMLPFYKEEELPSKEEPFTCDVVGFAFALIKKGVFEQIEYPWFTPYRYTLNDCVIESGEDIGLCMKLKALNIPVWIDPTVRIGHEKMVILK